MNPSSSDLQNSDSSLDSLEASSTVVEGGANTGGPGIVQPSPDGSSGSSSGGGSKPPRGKLWAGLVRRFNIYLLSFALLVLIIIIGSAILYIHTRNTQAKTGDIGSQSLSQTTLDQLANSDVTVGDAKQVLSVQSNAVFAGKVLVRDTLEVAGGLQVGGSLTLTGIKVAGTSIFDQVQITKDLAVSGDESIQGQLNIQKGISVNGSGTFNGALSASQLSVNSLKLSGDLNLTHHITAGGATPGRSNGTALGSGGTASVSGSDTAGSVSISTGSGPAAGCFLTINFTSAFNATPHINITPVGSAAAGLNYYINRSTANFSICSTNAAPGGSSFGFDYIVFD